MKMTRMILLLGGSLLATLAGCTDESSPATTQEMVVGLANPASVHCEEQGGTLEIRSDADGGQYGVCIFSDGSECEEWAYFNGECQPGQSDPESDPSSTLEIADSAQARQAVVTYICEQYGLSLPTEWEESTDGLVGSTTKRYMSEDWTIEVTAPVVPPDSTIYSTLVTQITTAFYWEGTISANGVIEEINLIPPATILNQEQSRDAIVAYMIEIYGLADPGAWTAQDVEQTVPGAIRSVYTAEGWVVEVVHYATAPVVGSYQVTVDIIIEVMRWEGEISSRGDITEIQVTQQ